jgi:hypothetical protein
LLRDDGHPSRIKLTPVPGFSLQAIAQWAPSRPAPGSTVFSSVLACFTAVIASGRKPKDRLVFQWINTVPGNIKTSLSGSDHAFDFQKYATPYPRSSTHHSFC